MFCLSFLNVDCVSNGRKFATQTEAMRFGQSVGFEFSVWHVPTNSLCATWSPITGLRLF